MIEGPLHAKHPSIVAHIEHQERISNEQQQHEQNPLQVFEDDSRPRARARIAAMVVTGGWKALQARKG